MRIIPSNWKNGSCWLKKQQIKLLPRNILGIEKNRKCSTISYIIFLWLLFLLIRHGRTLSPTTNLEALACGTPVITYNTGGSVESVAESVGFIVEKGRWKV